MNRVFQFLVFGIVLITLQSNAADRKSSAEKRKTPESSPVGSAQSSPAGVREVRERKSRFIEPHEGAGSVSPSPSMASSLSSSVASSPLTPLPPAIPWRAPAPSPIPELPDDSPKPLKRSRTAETESELVAQAPFQTASLSALPALPKETLRIDTPPFGEPIFGAADPSLAPILPLSQGAGSQQDSGSPSEIVGETFKALELESLSPMPPPPVRLPVAAASVLGKKKQPIKDSDEDSDSDEDTELMEAAFSGNVKTVRELLAAKADVNERNKQKQTALYSALLNAPHHMDKSCEIIRILLEHKADLHDMGHEEGALYMAKSHVQDPEIEKLLTEALAKSEGAGAGSSSHA